MKIDEAAAKNELQRLADEEGLEETTANVEAIKQFLKQHVRGYLSAEGVNAAYQNLGPRGSNVLTFKRVQPPPAPTPEPVAPAEVLGTLRNGEPQLPLHIVPNKHNTTAQLKDWLARTNAGKLVRSKGGFSSSIF